MIKTRTPMQKKKLLILFILSIFLIPCSILAQDTIPPTISIPSTDINPNGKRFDFLLNLSAADDIAVAGLQYRAKVDGQGFSPWTDYPYIAGYPLFFSVQCSFFAVEVRAVDISGNFSDVAEKEFRQPFKSAPGTPLTPGFVIDLPPSVLQDGSTTTILLKKFAVPKNTGKALRILRVSAAKKKALKPAVVYQVGTTNLANQAVKKTLSKRNSLTLKNLPPGNYSVSYQAQVVKKKVILSSSTESPSAIFSIF